MGTKLFSSYLDAAAGAAADRRGAGGGGLDWPGYDYTVETFRSLMPMLLETNALDPAEVEIDTLAERLRRDVVEHRGGQMLPIMFGAWARKPS